MARRPPKRAKDFSYDLLADWRPYADQLPEPKGESDWRLHGTVRLNGVTGGLAFRCGWFGIRVGAEPVRELGMWERIEIQNAIALKRVAGWEAAPEFEGIKPMPASCYPR